MTLPTPVPQSQSKSLPTPVPQSQSQSSPTPVPQSQSQSNKGINDEVVIGIVFIVLGILFFISYIIFLIRLDRKIDDEYNFTTYIRGSIPFIMAFTAIYFGFYSINKGGGLGYINVKDPNFTQTPILIKEGACYLGVSLLFGAFGFLVIRNSKELFAIIVSSILTLASLAVGYKATTLLLTGLGVYS